MTCKNSEMPAEHQKFKGRVCFDGRTQSVKNEKGVSAMFKHLDSLPASMPAGKAAMGFKLKII